MNYTVFIGHQKKKKNKIITFISYYVNVFVTIENLLMSPRFEIAVVTFVIFYFFLSYGIIFYMYKYYTLTHTVKLINEKINTRYFWTTVKLIHSIYYIKI